MEMMVTALRRAGEKLPKDDLPPPQRGWLRLERANIAGHQSLHACLHASTSRGAPAILPGLTEVVVMRLDERGVLLYGLQSVQPASPTAPKLPQAWWCAMVSPG